MRFHRAVWPWANSKDLVSLISMDTLRVCTCFRSTWPKQSSYCALVGKQLWECAHNLHSQNALTLSTQNKNFKLLKSFYTPSQFTCLPLDSVWHSTTINGFILSYWALFSSQKRKSTGLRWSVYCCLIFLLLISEQKSPQILLTIPFLDTSKSLSSI